MKDNLSGAARLAKKGLKTDAEIAALVSKYGAAAVSDETAFVRGVSATLDKGSMDAVIGKNKACDSKKKNRQTNEN